MLNFKLQGYLSRCNLNSSKLEKWVSGPTRFPDREPSSWVRKKNIANLDAVRNNMHYMFFMSILEI